MSPGDAGRPSDVAAADDQQILVDDAGRGERDRLLRRVAAQILAQIDAARRAEARDRLAGARVERVDDSCPRRRRCGGRRRPPSR